jgi:peptidoglycan/xylan/chitin deacetylase (PgdA/CDA1 family)
MDVVLGFDMETDIGSWTPFYEGLTRGTPVILDVLQRRGVTATFFFTGESAQQNPGLVRRVLDAGHEVGCHSICHENVGDPLFKIFGTFDLLPEEVFPRLRRATEMVQNACGRQPVSFRAPRLFGSTAMMNALERLGYAADASYPMYYYREQLAPYHPSAEDWTKKGGLRIVELPNFADLSMDSSDPYGRDRDQWPVFRTEGAEALMRHVDGFASYCAKRAVAPFLCFYFHPWEFHGMPQGEISFGEGSVRPAPFIVKNCGAYAAEQLDRLIQMLLDRGATFHQAETMARRTT